MSICGWNINNIVDTVSGFGFQGRCLTLVFALMHFFFVLAFPTLCCLRVDNIISSSWALVFTPLWILDTIYYGSFLFIWIFSTGKQRYTLCKYLLLVLVQVLIVAKLDSNVKWNLVAVLIPYFTYEFLNVLEVMVRGWLAFRMLLNDSVGAGVSQTEDIQTERQLLVIALVRKTGLTLMRIVQAFLIGVKVDGRLGNASWWRVMIPVWAMVTYLLWYPIKRYIKSTSTHRLMDAILTAGVILLFVAPFFLLTERLEGKRMSSFAVMMPWMLLICVVFLVLLCTISLAASERLIRSGIHPARGHIQLSLP